MRFLKSLEPVKSSADPHKQFGKPSGIADPMLRQKHASELNPQSFIDILSTEVLTEFSARHSFTDAPYCVSFVDHSSRPVYRLKTALA
jgi:hypothetical protein